MYKMKKSKADCILANALEGAKLLTAENIDNLISEGNYDDVLKVVENMKKAQELNKLRERVKVEVHPYAINHTETSGWYTYVKKENCDRKKIRKQTENDLLDALIDFYQISSGKKIITLKTLYDDWYKWKETPLNQENIKRLNYIWKAYYLDEELSKEIINMDINHISKKMLRKWAESLLKKHKPDTAKFNNMFSIISQLFNFAELEDIEIDTFLWQKARKTINSKLVYKKRTPDSASQVFTDEERITLKKEIKKDLLRYAYKPTVAGFQILFMLETALRIGEACGLKFEDIDFDNRILHVARQANNERVKEPKADSDRYIELTDEAMSILEDIKWYNEQHNLTADWVFQSTNAKYDYRLSYNAADRKLRKLCDRIETEVKSPHKLRKTCLSILCEEINPRAAQRFAGHSDVQTTLKYYCFDRKSKEEQRVLINDALSLNKEKKKHIV